MTYTDLPRPDSLTLGNNTADCRQLLAALGLNPTNTRQEVNP